MTTTTSIPLIDISEFSTGSEAGKKSVAADIGRVCEEIGLFTIIGHGIPQELLETTADLGKRFFDLSFQEKSAVMARSNAGYIPMLEEDVAGKKDCAPKEAYNVIKDKMQGLWPGRPQGLKETTTAYIKAMEKLAATLMRIFAVALGEPEDAFDDRFGESLSFLRIVNYPDQKQASMTGQHRCEPHTDLGTLTIIKSENRPGGLEVQSRDGEWIEVNTIPGSLIVNTGDEMWRWTKGNWVSPTHRVVNPLPEQRLDSRRLSLIYFHNPDSVKQIVNDYLEGRL